MLECWFGPLKICQGCVFRGMYQCDLNCLFFICSLCIRKSQKYCKNLWWILQLKKEEKYSPLFIQMYIILKKCARITVLNSYNYPKRLVHQICCKEMFWVLAVWSNPCILIDKRNILNYLRMDEILSVSFKCVVKWDLALQSQLTCM